MAQMGETQMAQMGETQISQMVGAQISQMDRTQSQFYDKLYKRHKPYKRNRRNEHRWGVYL